MKNKRIVLPIMISLMPSIIGMLLAFLWNGGRSGGIDLHPFLIYLAEPFHSGSLFYSMGRAATRLTVTIIVGILYIPIDVFVFLCLCICRAVVNAAISSCTHKSSDE